LELNEILTGDVAETLSLHPDIKDLRKHTDPNLLTDSGLPPKILGLNVIEAKGVEVTTYEGLSETFAYVFGKNALIAYVEPKPGLKKLSVGYIFRVKGYRKTKKWREDPKESDIIEVSDMFVPKLVSADAGYLIAAAIA